MSTETNNENGSSETFITEEIYLTINGQPKIVRLVFDHTLMNLAIPKLDEIVRNVGLISTEHWKKAKYINDYVSTRFAIQDTKITHAAEKCKGEVLRRIPEEKHNSFSTKLMFKHIEFSDVTASKLRESAIKVADNVASDNRYYVILVPAGDVDTQKLIDNACACLEKEHVGFECKHIDEVLKILRFRDPLCKDIEKILNQKIEEVLSG